MSKLYLIVILKVFRSAYEEQQGTRIFQSYCFPRDKRWLVILVSMALPIAYHCHNPIQTHISDTDKLSILHHIFHKTHIFSYRIQSNGLGGLTANSVFMAWPENWKNKDTWKKFVCKGQLTVYILDHTIDVLK